MSGWVVLRELFGTTAISVITSTLVLLLFRTQHFLHIIMRSQQDLCVRCQNTAKEWCHIFPYRPLSLPRDMYSLKRMSLESSMEGLREELASMHRQLTLEERWRSTADNAHRCLLEEKTQLLARYVHVQ